MISTYRFTRTEEQGMLHVFVGAPVTNAFVFYILSLSDGYEKLVRAREEGISGNSDDFDMFADDDGQAATKPSTAENNAVSEPSSDATNSGTEGKNIASITLASEMASLLLYFIFNVFNRFYFSFQAELCKVTMCMMNLLGMTFFPYTFFLKLI